MSAHHNHDDIQSLYEGDQSKLYSGVLGHHSGMDSPESKAQVKRIWKVTGILSIITIVEVLFGLLGHGIPLLILNTVFLVLTVVKAAYIVKVFMHLGDEKKSFVYFVLMPLLLFVWFIISFLMDGAHWLDMNFTQAHTIKDIFK
jgi:cytochrome c oxidase subunit 4